MRRRYVHGGNRSPGAERLAVVRRRHRELRPKRLAMEPLEERRLLSSGLKWELEPVFEGIPAMETPRDAAIIQAMEKLTGVEAGAVAFGTEGPYLNELGLQTVICGPGNIDQAHQPDEYLPLEHIHPGINLIQSLVKQFCL